MKYCVAPHGKGKVNQVNTRQRQSSSMRSAVKAKLCSSKQRRIEALQGRAKAMTVEVQHGKGNAHHRDEMQRRSRTTRSRRAAPKPRRPSWSSTLAVRKAMVASGPNAGRYSRPHRCSRGFMAHFPGDNGTPCSAELALHGKRLNRGDPCLGGEPFVPKKCAHF